MKLALPDFKLWSIMSIISFFFIKLLVISNMQIPLLSCKSGLLAGLHIRPR